MGTREDKCLRVRQNILKMVHKAKSGHPGGSLSAVELLVVLFEHMKHNPKIQNGKVGIDLFYQKVMLLLFIMPF